MLETEHRTDGTGWHLGSSCAMNRASFLGEGGMRTSLLLIVALVFALPTGAHAQLKKEATAKERLYFEEKLLRDYPRSAGDFWVHDLARNAEAVQNTNQAVRAEFQKVQEAYLRYRAETVDPDLDMLTFMETATDFIPFGSLARKGAEQLVSVLAEKTLEAGGASIRQGIVNRGRTFFLALMWKLEQNGTWTSFQQQPVGDQLKQLFDANGLLKQAADKDPEIKIMILDFLIEQQKRGSAARPRSGNARSNTALKNDENLFLKYADFHLAGPGKLAENLAWVADQRGDVDEAANIARWNSHFENVHAVSSGLLRFGEQAGMDRQFMESVNTVEKVSAFGAAATALALSPTPTPATIFAALDATGGLFSLFGARKGALPQKMQADILNGVRRIEAKLDRYHALEMAELYDIKVATFMSGAVTDHIAAADVLQCRALFEAELDGKRVHPEYSNRCRSGIRSIFLSRRQVHPALWLTPSTLAYGEQQGRRASVSGTAPQALALGGQHEIENFLSQYHAPTWSLLAPLLGTKTLSALAYPSRDVDGLTTKIERLSQQPTDDSVAEEDLALQLPRLLDANRLMEFAGYAVRYYTDTPTKTASQADQQPLSAAMYAMNLAVAQQAYLGGDMFLPLLLHIAERDWAWFDPSNKESSGVLEVGSSSRLTDAPTAESAPPNCRTNFLFKCAGLEAVKGEPQQQLEQRRSALYNASLSAMNGNPILARNVIMLAVRGLAKGPEVSAFVSRYRSSYDLACRRRTPATLRAVVDLPFPLVHRAALSSPPDDNEACWYVAISTSYGVDFGRRLLPGAVESGSAVVIALPKPSDVEKGEFETPSIAPRLWGLRDRIAGELAFQRMRAEFANSPTLLRTLDVVHAAHN